MKFELCEELIRDSLSDMEREKWDSLPNYWMVVDKLNAFNQWSASLPIEPCNFDEHGIVEFAQRILNDEEMPLFRYLPCTIYLVQKKDIPQ